MTRLKRKKLSIERYCRNKQASQIYMYTSFFKRGRGYGRHLKRREIINQEILPQQKASQICMYTFFKRERKYDTFKRKKLSIKRYCHDKWRARYACLLRSLSVSENMTRLSERNYQSRDTATTNGEPDMHVYFVL